MVEDEFWIEVRVHRLLCIELANGSYAKTVVGQTIARILIVLCLASPLALKNWGRGSIRRR